MSSSKRVALITGGTKGIGAAAALALAQAGIDVALVARHDGQHAKELQDRVRSLNRRCELILADVASHADALRCVDETRERLGPVTILIHSAGGPYPKNILELEPEEWHRAFDVHVHAAFYLCRATIPTMRERRDGSIVLISSGAGHRGCPANFAYQVVKGALPQFARALAREYAADNIRVNCVAPGIIRTAFHDPMTSEQRQHNLEHRIPLRREGTAAQVATLIKEVALNEYITGETVTIDGGLTMRMP